MRVYLESLGCSRNQIDSETMLGRLRAQGHDISSDPARAEAIIVNTCGFISAASEEAVDTILELAGHKKTGECRRLIVTGCLAQRFKEDTLAASLPEVDAFLGTGAVDAIVQAVEGERPLTLFPDILHREFQGFPHPRELTLDYSAFVKVSEGCDRKCTYCIIPELRGVQRSRPGKDIVAEAEHLFSRGVRELILVGENTTDYGSDLEWNTELSDILTRISHKAREICKDETVWIRLLYTHPSSLSEKIIKTMSRLENICSYYDVPVQHASSPVLKKMGRHYTEQELYSLFALIRKLDPAAALRTTLINGFPGETEADFQVLRRFIQSVAFDHVGVFTYSDSEDLASHRLKDHVPKELAIERHDVLMAEQVKISEKINEKYFGKTCSVLVEENPDEGIYLGRTGFQAPDVDGITFIYGTGLEIGTFVDVTITETHEYDLAGEAV
ncbi:MAG: 30S ribosomal protein S12 methylthiotransferase RimO [Desulfobacteraceae bacterium]